MDHPLSQRILQAIQHIPRGKVATYGQIAGIAGNSRASRLVVRTLRSREGANLPWHRVINSQGMISLRGRGYEEQRRLLESEGIIFDEHDRVNLRRFQWQDVSL